jgi:3-methyladenine DNA glycosylase Tag
MTIEIPLRARPAGDAGYLEEMTKAIFRSGFSWQVIRDKWPNFQRAFGDFVVERVADYDDRDVDRLLADPGIVRNGRKIEATIQNARQMRTLIARHNSFFSYLRTLDGQSYSARRAELCRRFRQMGPTAAFVFLYCVDEEVPAWQDRNL